MINIITESAKSIITPEEAQELINRYEASTFKNRKPYKATVNLYANEQRDGKWVLNGETIKLDKNGVPIDGLNRLTACVKSQTPFECFIVQLEGEIEPIVSTIDIGRKRSVENALEFQGEMVERNVMGIVRYHNVLKKGGKSIGQSDINNDFPRQWLIEQYKGSKDIYSDAARYARNICKKSPMKANDVGGIYMHLTCDLGWDIDIVEEFFNNLKAVAPAIDRDLFARTYTALDNKNVRNTERTEIYMRCWNNWRNGNRVRFTITSDHFFAPSEIEAAA